VNFTAAFEACRTPADFYRLQISLENECAPAELLPAFECRDRLPAPARKWIERLHSMMRRGGQTFQPFAREVLAENALFFHDGSIPRHDKSLLVCFCGNFQRLMIQLPVFLQHVPARDFDVLVFRDPRKLFFLRGVPGYVPDLAALPERLGRDLCLERYASVRCLGTSAGGAAGLAAGAVLGAERALSFGGAHPSRAGEYLAEYGLNGCEFDAFFRDADCGRLRLRAFFGAGNAHDLETAASLCRAFPGVKAVRVDGMAEHNIFFELFERGDLQGFLDKNLLGPGREVEEGFLPEIGNAPAAGPVGPTKRIRFSLDRLRKGWRRFGGWEQFVYWCVRLSGSLQARVRRFWPGRKKS
jgi:hypothetical protein